MKWYFRELLGVNTKNSRCINPARLLYSEVRIASPDGDVHGRVRLRY
jgi:hypothetical protein